MPFALSSPAFADGAEIPRSYTCDGENRPPRLTWHDPPTGTRSFALIVDDPDAPSGTFTHWVLFDVPAGMTELSETAGAVGRQGRNDFGKNGYGGPCPPKGHGPHRYFFKLSALNLETLELPDGTSRSRVEAAMQGHTLATAQFAGRYERK
ncbi:MAG: YbhB/YbcL family Raf kinase inhibitor-like protein [Vicinamibacterales bacterium]